MVSKNTFKPQAAECQCIHCSKLWCNMLLSSNTGSSTSSSSKPFFLHVSVLCPGRLLLPTVHTRADVNLVQGAQLYMYFPKPQGLPWRMPSQAMLQPFSGLFTFCWACFAVGLVAKLDQLFGLILCIFDASHNYQQVLFQDFWLSLLSFLKGWLGASQHLCQLLKHGLLVLQACLAQGLFFTFFKASSKLLWVLVGISLAFFSFFKPSSKDKGASPSSSSSSSSPSPLVKAAKFPFLPSALPLPLPLPFSRPLLCLFQGCTRECRSLSKAFCHSSSSSSPIGIFLAKVARLCMPAHICFHHIRSIHRLPAAPSTGAFAGDQSSTFQMHVLLLLCPLGIHLFLCQPLLFLFQGAFSGGTLGDLAKGGLAFLHQEDYDYVGQAFFFLAHRLIPLFQGFIALLFQVGLVLVIGIALFHQRHWALEGGQLPLHLNAPWQL